VYVCVELTGRVSSESSISDRRDEEIPADWTDTTRADEDISHHASRL